VAIERYGSLLRFFAALLKLCYSFWILGNQKLNGIEPNPWTSPKELPYKPNQVIKGICDNVTDGDTLTVTCEDTEHTIRLDGIDCPEINQPYGGDSFGKLQDLANEKPVTVYVKTTDKYGRLVGRVYVNGVDASLALIKSGLAWHYKKYSEDTILASAETTARSAKVGLWAGDNPIAPWTWRQTH